MFLLFKCQGSSVLFPNDERVIKVYKTLVKLMEELPEQIVRVHRKFAIHKNKVSYIDHEDRMFYLQGMKRGIDIGEVFYPNIVEILSSPSHQ